MDMFFKARVLVRMALVLEPCSRRSRRSEVKSRKEVTGF